jgi:bifunctional non-homologous end joining protein LigD
VSLRSDKPAHEIVRERPAAAAEVAQDIEQAAPAAKRAPKPAEAAKAELAGIRLTHPERVIDRSTGLTKRDLARYYDSVAEFLLPHVKGRPVALVRGPEGVDSALFFQKHGAAAIAGLREFDSTLWPGHEPLLEVATHQAVLGAAQMNVIEFHTWNAPARHLERPDRMVFDLDPGEGVAWPAIREAALLTRTLLQELGLRSWLKTSGGKGLHLVVPIMARWPHDVVKKLSQTVVRHLARTIPSRFVAKSGPANRVGRIYVDYLRNGEGATTIAAFSARARPGLGVSMPLEWDELASLKRSDQWTIVNTRDRLSLPAASPWEGLQPQSLAPAMKALHFEASERSKKEGAARS